MSETKQGKHTPGPWVVVDINNQESDNCRYELQGELRDLPYEATYGQVEERHKANMALIAAAPDLLEALKEILIAVRENSFMAQLVTHFGGQLEAAEGCKRLVKKSEAAIAKATNSD